MSPSIERLRIHTSFVQRLPLVKRLYRHYLPLFPTAIEQFSFDRFDLVVSLSHCCAKSIVHPARVKHLCYCLTPMRYAWDQFDAYFGPQRLGSVGSADDAARSWPGWRDGIATPRTARTAMSLSLTMLRAGSADTIIASRQ